MSTTLQPVVLITGASSGLGRATAALLAASGYRVFGTSRAPRPEPTLPYAMLPLDVRSDESVRRCVKAVLEAAGRVDVLVNNAGSGLAGALEEAGLAQAQSLFETNFFGTVRMVNAVLPDMRRQRGGSIINISSAAGLGGVPFEGFYSASKHALEGYSEALRLEVKALGIRVSLVEPGFFQSDFGRANQAPEGAIADYAPMRRRAATFFEHALATGPAAEDVARVVLRVVRARNPRLRYLAGADARVIALGKRALPAPLAEALVRLLFRLDDRPAPEALLAAALRLLGVGWAPTRHAEGH